MGEQVSAPTPFEREIAEVSAFDLRSVVEPLVLLVYTDEAEIHARLEVPSSKVESELLRLNALAPRESSYGRLKWRRGIVNHSDAGHYCLGCGARRCWCGESALLTREGIPAWG